MSFKTQKREELFNNMRISGRFFFFKAENSKHSVDVVVLRTK